MCLNEHSFRKRKSNNLEIEKAFSVETCGRCQKPGFFDARALTNYECLKIIFFEHWSQLKLKFRPRRRDS